MRRVNLLTRVVFCFPDLGSLLVVLGLSILHFTARWLPVVLCFGWSSVMDRAFVVRECLQLLIYRQLILFETSYIFLNVSCLARCVLPASSVRLDELGMLKMEL